MNAKTRDGLPIESTVRRSERTHPIIVQLTHRYPGTLVFAIVVVLGEFSCFCTLFVKDYWGLFASRAFTGMAIGGASPLIYSIIVRGFGSFIE